ncbi:MAG: hypothetical protein K2Y09_07285 [Nitrosomonas sp.]|uniref:DUF5677 domain-containing protein n=1 Tax=Nitrosomonas sp. TaxID=42353 RepID=UPI001DDBCF6F|nr:DUF5677 domain-containing protein [Nitrosomonas sp.]MBX9894967.1 hypothetical protein [Nitrosomonas sp.]
MTNAQDYATLLDLFIGLVESQAGKKIEQEEAWLNDAQVLANKLFRHLVSMQTLAAGATLETTHELKICFVDHSSVKIIARAALETYLVFFYLYGSPDRSLCRFRHMTWELGGLTDRQSFHTSTQQGHEALAKEKSIITKLQTEIQASPWLNDYTEKQQKKLLAGEWRIGKSWIDLGTHARFHKKYFENIYGYLCSYSHSSYLSALQVEQAHSIEDQQKLTEVILDIGVVLMAHFAFSYSETFSDAKRILSANPALASIAEKWRFDAEDMATFYDR